MGLPYTQKGYDVNCVIVDRLTKSSHLLPMKSIFLIDRLAKLYMEEIFKLHGIPISIVSDRDQCFTSLSWLSLQSAMEMKLKFSTGFHP